MKINQLWNLLKTKMLPAFLVANALAMSFAVTGCGDKPNSEIPETPQEPQKPPVVVDNDKDKEKELADAIAVLNKFMADAKVGKNFIFVSESANNQTHTYYADADKTKIEYSDVITYIENEEDTIYKVFQAEDQSWHKDIADEGTKDANDMITSFIVKVNAISWSEYDSQTKMLKYELNNESATATLDTDKITVNVIAADDAQTFILKNVGTTTVTLLENIIDDTQTVTPPDSELTEEQKQAIMTKNLFNAIGEKAFESVLGRGTQINNIYAIDYVSNADGDYIYMLIDNTTMSGRKINFVRFPSTSELTDKNILTNNIAQITTRCGEGILSQSATMLETANSEKSLNIFEKLKNEKLITTLKPDICVYSTVVAGVDPVLHCGTHSVSFYILSKRGLEYSRYLVKSDGGTLDHISDYLINGTVDVTFSQTDSFYHEFTENVIYDFNGLQYLPEE